MHPICWTPTWTQVAVFILGFFMALFGNQSHLLSFGTWQIQGYGTRHALGGSLCPYDTLAPGGSTGHTHQYAHCLGMAPLTLPKPQYPIQS